eukprot:m51a1_g10489 hypothetical protein (1469) ;mRNA; r:61817-66685
MSQARALFAVAAVLAALAVAATAAEVPRRVIVQLEDPPAGLTRSDRSSSARAIQDRFLHTLKRDGLELSESLLERGARREARFTTVLNAVAVNVPAGTDDVGHVVERMRSLPGVVNAWPDSTYQESLFASGPLVGLPSAWTELLPQRAGQGMKVAVVDGGTNKDVPMMSGAGFSWPDDIPAPGRGETENCNAKLVVSRLYQNPLDPAADDDTHSWPGPRKSSHGVHTSSTAAGVPVTIETAEGPRNISGMAPYAWVMNYRVFYVNRAGATVARSVELLAALEDAVNDGAHVISNSWGDTAMQDSRGVISVFSQRATLERNVVFVYAAGNSGNYLTTMDHPETTSIRVAASSTAKSSWLGVSTQPAWQPLFPDIKSAKVGIQVATSATKGWITALAAPKTNSFACRPLEGNYSGRAVVVYRLVCPAQTKIDNAAAAGASMLIVINRDELILDNTFDDARGLAVVGVSNGAGNMLLGMMKTTPELPIRFEVTSGPSAGADVVADFSSRGPSTDMTLGPDVSAPGSQIVAQGYGTGSGAEAHFGFGPCSGTSMACPHVAGIAALIRQRHPEFTAAEVKSALMTTATTNVSANSARTVMASPFDTGAGRVDVARALDPALFLEPQALSFSVVEVNRTHALRLTMRAYRALSNVTLAFSSVAAPLYVNNSLAFSVSPSVVASVSAGQAVEFTVSFYGSENKDYVAYLRIASGGAEVGHAPVWARAVLPKAEDVFIVDMDGSSCYGLPDVVHVYQEALAAAGYTSRNYTFPRCVKGFSFPRELLLGSYGTVLVVTGSASYRNLPDLTLRYADMTALANQGTAFVTMGGLIPTLWGLLSGTEPTTLNTLCGAAFKSAKAVTQVLSHASAPAAFQGLDFQLPRSLSVVEFAVNPQDTPQDVPLLAAAGSAPSMAIGKAFVRQEVPGTTSFRSACAMSTLGLEDLPAERRTAFVRDLMSLLHPARPASYTVAGSGSDPVRAIDVEISDSKFAAAEVIVIWGDNGNTRISYPYGGEVSHAYIEVGIFVPVVMVRNTVGRIYALEHNVSFTIASLPSFVDPQAFQEPPVLSTSIAGEVVAVRVELPQLYPPRWDFAAWFHNPATDAFGPALAATSTATGFTATASSPLQSLMRSAYPRITESERQYSIEFSVLVSWSEAFPFAGKTVNRRSNATLSFAVVLQRQLSLSSTVSSLDPTLLWAYMERGAVALGADGTHPSVDFVMATSAIQSGFSVVEGSFVVAAVAGNVVNVSNPRLLETVSGVQKWRLHAELSGKMCTTTPADGFTLSYVLASGSAADARANGTIRASLGGLENWCKVNNTLSLDGEQRTYASAAADAVPTLRFFVGDTVHVRDTVFTDLSAGVTVLTVDVAGKAVKSGGSVNVYPGTAPGLEFALESCPAGTTGKTVCYRFRLDGGSIAPGQALTISTSVSTSVAKRSAQTGEYGSSIIVGAEGAASASAHAVPTVLAAAAVALLALL